LRGFYTNYYARRGYLRQSPPSNRFWRVASQVSELGVAGENVADIGCGDGHLCAQLKARGWKHVVGIDVSETRIAAARRSYPDVTFYHQRLQETGLPHASFDLIIMDNVIEHLASPQRAMEEVCQYLKPGGYLLVITPNMESGSFRLLGRYWTPELAPHAHVFLFTRHALVHLLERAGVHTVTAGGFQPIPASREWISSLRDRDLKAFVWRTCQHLGRLFGQIIGAGDMTYVLCKRPAYTRPIQEPPPQIAKVHRVHYAAVANGPDRRRSDL
jgi:2-polyprenyl-3-methyl-5-hydroxy-6-metoxy-1,4-benzoquinol methylase